MADKYIDWYLEKGKGNDFNEDKALEIALERDSGIRAPKHTLKFRRKNDMALTTDTVRKICDIVNKDADCRSVINTDITSPVLQLTGLAGAARNLMLISGDIIPPLATRSINEMLGRKVDNTNLLCLGITVATQKAILRERKSLPEMHGCAAISRVHWGVHHTVTWICMKDYSEYAFDWHATLNIYDPLLSRVDDWKEAKGGVFARNFSGFA